MKTSKQVHLNGSQFGFLKDGQFEEVMRKISLANEIPMRCSCGVCTVDAAEAVEIKRLLTSASEANAAVNKISDRIKAEGYYLNMAASGHSHVAEVSEEYLRHF